MKLTTLNNPTINEKLIDDVKRICHQYHIYCKIVDYKVNTIDTNAGVYVIASLNPILNDVDPMQIIDRNERHKSLFYPENFAIKLTNNNQINYNSAIFSKNGNFREKKIVSVYIKF